MSRIANIIGREVLDSRGLPTVEVDVYLASGHKGRMMVPSGASKGRFEAHELRDLDPRRYQGKGVLQAVRHVNKEIAGVVVGMEAEDQEALDQVLTELDGTPSKRRLGANAILGVSFAALRASAQAAGMPVYRYLAERYLPAEERLSLPMPMVNIISGGMHAGEQLDIQDYMVIPVGAPSLARALEMVSAVYWATHEILAERGHIVSLTADEGGFGPLLPSNEAPLEVLHSAMERAGLVPGDEMAIALDVAASHFHDDARGRYALRLDGRELTAAEMILLLEEWAVRYPILSVEDGLDEQDWHGWQHLTDRLGSRIQLVGDDLFTTNPQRIRHGIRQRAANAVLVKMNQIGTVTEVVAAVRLARQAGLRTVFSARSGETEDATLADMAVGLNAGQIKVGSLARSSRLSKYNQLLRISEQLPDTFSGRSAIGKKGCWQG